MKWQNAGEGAPRQSVVGYYHLPLNYKVYIEYLSTGSNHNAPQIQPPRDDEDPVDCTPVA